mmetsp:Transcript_41971/g.111822  ORF Transcript_41971/g.111822 Transcript_41971/m.111822 type:complete len:221 (+) Transcript_41971:825-1487(+)
MAALIISFRFTPFFGTTVAAPSVKSGSKSMSIIPKDARLRNRPTNEPRLRRGLEASHVARWFTMGLPSSSSWTGIPCSSSVSSRLYSLSLPRRKPAETPVISASDGRLAPLTFGSFPSNSACSAAPSFALSINSCMLWLARRLSIFIDFLRSLISLSAFFPIFWPMFGSMASACSASAAELCSASAFSDARIRLAVVVAISFLNVSLKVSPAAERRRLGL